MQTKHTESNRIIARTLPRLARAPLIEAQKAQVGQIMSQPAITVRPDMSVETVAGLMLKNSISRLPVVDDDGKLLGVISKTDLIAVQLARGDTSELQPDEGRWREGVPLAQQGFHLHQPEAILSEVMHPSAVSVTVTETTSIAQAAELMALQRLHGVPVLASSGKVTGMLSLLDIAGWVAGLV